MGKIDSVFHNFANHLTSGLSGFVTAAYDACDRASLRALVLPLLPQVQLPEPLQSDADFEFSAQSLREKFAEILSKQSGLPLDQILSLVVEFDFIPDESCVQERQRMMKRAQDAYAYNPVYRCTIFMRDASGQERRSVLEDLT